MTTWITRLDHPPADLAVAVKDAIDLAGIPTTAGCRAVAERAVPAESDAACLAGFRAQGDRLVALAGKTNLHELCFGTTGVNPWFGTPVNPRAPDRIPGGSSSGSAVAVAAGEAGIALGTDTGGSVRIPAACCGVVGLKTTWGRIPLAGVWPLAPSLDTVGPLAPTMAGVVTAMAMLDPAFAADKAVATSSPAAVVGRLRVPGIDPVIDAAVDAALAEAGLDVVAIDLEGWEATRQAFRDLLLAEAWRCDAHLIGSPGVSQDVSDALRAGGRVSAEDLARARAVQAAWQDELGRMFRRVQLIALPTIECAPPRLDAASGVRLNRLTAPWNLAGTPGLSLPVGGATPVPASLQLVGPAGSEELLCSIGSVVEAACGGVSW